MGRAQREGNYTKIRLGPKRQSETVVSLMTVGPFLCLNRPLDTWLGHLCLMFDPHAVQEVCVSKNSYLYDHRDGDGHMILRFTGEPMPFPGELLRLSTRGPWPGIRTLRCWATWDQGSRWRLPGKGFWMLPYQYIKMIGCFMAKADAECESESGKPS